ncbi:MAG: hypothetical protein L3J93_05500 [Thermoplasmata archaeon]|nr:hypothetical protein [Thermoplasmata archaeon]
MALFSDIDWAILLVAGAFLLFGKDNAAVLRTLGRYYGRALRLKQELLDEVRRAADLPVTPSGSLPSIRQAILDLDGPIAAGAPQPHLPRSPASLTARPAGPSSWAVALGEGTWSLAEPAAELAPRGPP